MTTTPKARVYVAAPYARATHVRTLHAWLELLDFEPCASWADKARGPENLPAMTDAERQAAIDANDRDLLSADLVLVLAYAGEGGEMFAELERARAFAIPAVWCGGRLTLSAFRENVRARVLRDVDAMAEIRKWRAENARRFFLPVEEPQALPRSVQP